jgi:hypothetical protein
VDGGEPGSGNHIYKYGRLYINPNLGKSLWTPYLVGYIAGMYLYSAKLTSNRAGLVGYINNRFGLRAVRKNTGVQQFFLMVFGFILW